MILIWVGAKVYDILPSGDAYMCDIVFNYLELIRIYDPDKQSYI